MKRLFLLMALLVGLGGMVLSFLKWDDLFLSERGRYERDVLQLLEQSELKAASMKKEAKIKNKEKGGLGFPHLQALQDVFFTMDPALKRVPAERLMAAYQYTRSLATKQSLIANSLISWNNVTSDMGGRVRAVAWDPNDPLHAKAWAGAVTGGLWYNNDVADQNSPWVAVDDFWSGLSVSCIAFDPLDPQVMYVGTGEAPTATITYRESCGRGVGIFKSTDAGQSWSLLPSTAAFTFVNDILVREEAGNSVVYAGVVSGIYMGAAHQSQPSDGLFRSDNGGTSWTQVLPNITGENKPWAVSDIDMNSNGRIFIGTQRNLDGKGGATILYSDAGTAGSWTVFNNYLLAIPSQTDYYLPGRVMIATAPSNPNIVYAIIGAGYLSGWEVYHGRYFLQSTNQGLSWTAKNTPPDYQSRNWANLAWHAFTIGVDPGNANTVWIGGLDLNRTTNGGQSWTKLSDWALMYSGGGPEYVHADLHSVSFNAASPGQALFGCDGGVFYTANPNAASPAFMERSKNLSTLQFYTCAINPTPASNQLVGGLQDNGTLWYTGNNLTINDMLSGGDGAFCFIDQDDPNLMITSIYYNVYYIFNGGSFLNYVDAYQSGYFINPADYDYRFNTLYANAVPMFGGGNQDMLLRIQDIDGTANGQFLNLGTGSTLPFSHVKVSPNSSLGNIRVFLGSMSGRLFKLSYAQSTPLVTEIGDNNFPLATISGIAVGKSDDTLLVCFSNYGVPSVWQTFDGGLNWRDIEGNLPDMPVRWVLFHPQNAQQALIATELGVWSSSNLFASSVWWAPANDGLANVRVDMLQVRNSDRRVCAASHGRGLFTGTYLFDPTSAVDQPASREALPSVFPNPAKGQMFLKLPAAGKLVLGFYSSSGKRVATREISPAPSATVVPLDISGLPAGVYLLDIQQGSTRCTQKVVINR